MTYKEKFKMEHPEMGDYEVKDIIHASCPGDFGYQNVAECFCGGNGYPGCSECWDAEYEEETEGIPKIKDSGERTEFSTGAVRDMHAGKGDMASVPWEAILRLSVHYENGAQKYERWNFRKGIPVSSFIDSACRHLAKYQCGLDDEDHLAAAAFNVLGAMLMENTMPDMVDLPLRKSKNTFDYFKNTSD